MRFGLNSSLLSSARVFIRSVVELRNELRDVFLGIRIALMRVTMDRAQEAPEQPP